MGFRHYAYRPKIAGTDKRYPRYKIKFFRDKKFLFQEGTDHTDERLANALGRKRVQELEHDAHLEKIGAPRISDRTLRELANEYIEDGKDSRGLRQNPWSEKHASNIVYGFKWWLSVTGWKVLADINLKDAKKALREKISPRTGKLATGKSKNNTMAVIQGFITYCWENKFLPRTVNPIEGWRPYPDDPEPSRRSRDYELHEFRALCMEASPSERIAYLVAASTAIRFSNLKRRQIADADFVKSRIRIERRANKSRKEVWKQVPQWIMDMVKAEALGRKPADPLLLGLVGHHGGKTIQRQLRRVGVPVETQEGRLTFHGLKVHFVNMLWELGTDSKTVQDMAEHATLDLSTKTYGRQKEIRQREFAEGVGERLRLSLVPPSNDGVTIGAEEQGEPMQAERKMVGAVGFEPTPGTPTNIRNIGTSRDSNATRPKAKPESQFAVFETRVGQPGTNPESQWSNKLDRDMAQMWPLLTPEMRQSVVNHARGCLMGLLPNKKRTA